MSVIYKTKLQEFESLSKVGSIESLSNVGSLDSFDSSASLHTGSSLSLSYKDPGITVLELKKLLPAIFRYKQSLSQYFSQELFFADNLSELSSVFPRLAKFYDNEEYETLNFKVNTIREIIDDNNEQLQQSFEETIQFLNLEIFTNVKFYGHLNNAKPMALGIIKFKECFQKYVTKLKDLDDYLMEINDIIDSQDQKQNQNQDQDQDRSNSMKKLNPLLVFNLNNNISSLSDTLFQELIHKTISIFDEMIRKFNYQNLDDKDRFSYEILSFDDHLKSI